MTLFSVADHHHHVLNCSLLYFSTIVDFVPCKHDANCPTRLAVLSTHAVLVLDIPSSETPAGWGGDRTCKKASSRLGRKLAKNLLKSHRHACIIFFQFYIDNNN